MHPVWSGTSGKWSVDLTGRRQGGQAEVYRARGPDGRVCAVRVPRSGSPAWFERECGLLAGIGRADWIVSVLDTGRAPDGRPFMVIDWYDTNLEDWLCSVPPPPIEAVLRALEQAAAAVLRLHRAPADLAEVLVHRDIKPGNFLVRQEEGRLVVVLADLGIAKQGRVFGTTDGNTGAYTDGYAPVEQQVPLESSADTRLDVHALGATVYAALCGRLPLSLTGRMVGWKPEVRELLALHSLGPARTEEEGIRHRELRRRDIGAFYDFTDAVALLPADLAELRHRLEEQLQGRVDDTAGAAKAVFKKLMPILSNALEPNPGRRLGDAQRLYATIVRCRELVQEALLDTAPPVAPPAAPPRAATLAGTWFADTAPPATDPPGLALPARRERTRGRVALWGVGAAGAGLIVVGLMTGVLAFAAWWSREDVATSDAAPSAPLAGGGGGTNAEPGPAAPDVVVPPTQEESAVMSRVEARSVAAGPRPEPLPPATTPGSSVSVPDSPEASEGPGVPSETFYVVVRDGDWSSATQVSERWTVPSDGARTYTIRGDRVVSVVVVDGVPSASVAGRAVSARLVRSPACSDWCPKVLVTLPPSSMSER